MTADGLRLMCVLAHPDDESLGAGGTLAHYAAEGTATYLVTATRGEAGRFGDGTDHPGPEALARIRERELRDAADVLGLRDVRILGYPDGKLDRADPDKAMGRIVSHLRRVRPQVVITFDPSGAYGHPDHVAVCQLTTAACVLAADPSFSSVETDAGRTGRPHRVSKLYYMAWTPEIWDIYQSTFKKLVSRVDGVERQATPWPSWALSARLDAADHWSRVWRAVRCHESQMAIYEALGKLEEEDHRTLWGTQTFYRAYSTVSGGRRIETDLFEGIR